MKNHVAWLPVEDHAYCNDVEQWVDWKVWYRSPLKKQVHILLYKELVLLGFRLMCCQAKLKIMLQHWIYVFSVTSFLW